MRSIPVSVQAGAVSAIFLTVSLAAETITPVPKANPRVAGQPVPNVLSPELTEAIAAQGSWPLENPSALIGYYGYNTDGTLMPAAGLTPTATQIVEATKTEPDKNTYLVLSNQHGADPSYNYGTHFLFQGHEAGVDGAGYITRINLDADGPHRITLLAATDANGKPLPVFDGSTWYPFSNHLLFTNEDGGGVWTASPDFPSRVESLAGILGQGGYEGIQADNTGRLIIVEDVGGRRGKSNPHARQPNSFVYRFVPNNPSNLKMGGKLQALQAMSRRHPGPIVFGSDPDADIKSLDTMDLHTYGFEFQTRWITIHDTATDGTAPFDSNALAKKAGATPFKRPENGQFRPGTNFTEFVFDATGDTDALTEAGKEFGGFGALFRLRTNGDTGVLSLFYLSDEQHAGFDNVAFWTADKVVFVEDAGDGLHSQRNALDSAFLFDLNVNYANAANQPVRILAEGRDPSATIDTELGAFSGFQNSGDNEITGWHVSDGDPAVNGLLGAKVPNPFEHGWRVFWTQQHGDNNTWEVFRKGTASQVE